MAKERQILIWGRPLDGRHLVLQALADGISKLEGYLKRPSVNRYNDLEAYYQISINGLNRF